MKYISVLILFLLPFLTVSAQSDIYGEWVGFIVEKGKQYHFELEVINAEGEFTSKRERNFDLKGRVIDLRDSLKMIEILGYLNSDQTINAYDTKIIKRDYNDGELRSRYQFHIEVRNGEPWMIGYWQDYNHLDHEKAKGRFFLKRREKPDIRA